VGEVREAGRPTWAEIDLGALRRNLRAVRDFAGDRRIIAVVKADGYGHGAVPVARELERAGAEMLAVATVDEADELRQAGVRAPVMLLQGLHRPEEAETVVALDLVPLVGRLDMLAPLDAAAGRAGRALPVHLKFDTGMGRLGFLPEEAGAILDALGGHRHLELSGLATHLAEADDSASSATETQRRRFGEVVESVRTSGFTPEWIHADNSPGVLRGGTPGASAARPGLLLYGADPTLEGGHALEPVMTLVTRVIRAQDVPAGSRIGYGGTYVAPCRTRLLTLPIGYADGLPRAAGGRAEVGLRGRRVPLVGRVSMDLAAVDAGPSSDVEVGEEVLVFGRRGELTIRVERIAEATDTIPYEILVRVGSRVPRIPRNTPHELGRVDR
jgi:alanine racemase